MSGEPKKLVHVFATFGAGGPQIRAVQLMSHLGPGYRHVVMAMDGRTDAAAQLPPEVPGVPGLIVEFVPPPPRAGFVRTMRTQQRWLARLQPDLVLTYNWGAIESAAAARRRHLPLVHHEDGFGREESERRLRRRNWVRRLVLRSVPVIVPSLVLQGIARAEWRLADERLHHCDNGVDLARFQPGPRRPEGALVIGTVGGLRPEKDHATLLRAFAALDSDVRLRIVGDGALAPTLRAMVGSLGLEARVELVGAVTDTAPEYRRFDAFVLSSRTEQMPIAMLEAMASGLAVVATDVGDVRAILPESQARFVVARENPLALASALRELLMDADRRRRLGVENRTRIERRYEAGACLDRYVRIYEANLAP